MLLVFSSYKLSRHSGNFQRILLFFKKNPLFKTAQHSTRQTLTNNTHTRVSCVFFAYLLNVARRRDERRDEIETVAESRHVFVLANLLCFLFWGEIGLGDRHEQFLLFSVIKRKSIIFQHVLFDSTCKIGREGQRETPAGKVPFLK